MKANVEVGQRVMVSNHHGRGWQPAKVVKIGRTLVYIVKLQVFSDGVERASGSSEAYYIENQKRRGDVYGGSYRTVEQVAEEDLRIKAFKVLRDEFGISIKSMYDLGVDKNFWSTAQLVELVEAVTMIRGEVVEELTADDLDDDKQIWHYGTDNSGFLTGKKWLVRGTRSTEHVQSSLGCQCVMFSEDEDVNYDLPVCECGHVDDEHDDSGACQIRRNS